MAPMPVQRASDGAAFVGRTARGQIPLLLALPLLLLGALLIAPVHALVARPVLTFSGAAATDLSPAELTALAATLLERATAEGGSGYTFTIVQHASLDRRPGGPPIAIDPLDEQGKGGSTTDHYALATYLERGAASSAGFWLEIRDGPVGDEPPDFAGATYQLGAIVRDDKTFRNDGDGWYRTDDPPGIGLDPRTAGLLPAMLRGATGTKDRDQAPGDDPTAARGLEATTTVAELPGLIAVDAGPASLPARCRATRRSWATANVVAAMTSPTNSQAPVCALTADADWRDDHGGGHPTEDQRVRQVTSNTPHGPPPRWT
ncbi:MAG: hypothetical protein E4H24_06525 [Thermomicrobiales bacterium]|nr:MAG: hypothetical protein E4H24_06525 [Thermomicrobiales bacterium]